MSKFSISMDSESLAKLNRFMKLNNIKNRSKAIQKCIELISNEEDYRTLILQMNNTLDKINSRVNLQRKLLEQNFVNHGFPFNYSLEADKALEEFYKFNRKSMGSMFD